MINLGFKETEIGSIPEEWEILNVGKIGRVVTGKTPPTIHPEFYGDDFPFIKIPDMTDTVYVKKTDTKISQKGARYLGNAKLPKDSIMVSCIATVGNVGISSEESFTNQQINTLIPDRNIADFKYLYYYFKVNKKLLESLGGGGSVYTNISKSKFENMPVVIPELQEQTRIAEILSSLDDKIELNRQINVNLEKIASALFKRWFVDFEFPDENGKPYKSSGGKMVESELGEIPEGWKVGKLSDIANITIGRTPPRLQEQWFSKNPEDMKWISIRDLGNSGIYIDKTAEFLTRDAVEKFNIPIIPKNTVILSFKLTVGRLAITSEEMLSNEAIAHIKLSDENVSIEYIYLSLKKFDYSSLGSTSSIATAVNSKSIKDIPLLIPNGKVVTVFTENIAPTFQSIFENTRQLDMLIETRDSLLPKLMSGKIRVRYE
jgi:type I restriction enzyme S subunit